MNGPSFDVLIVGGGMVGASLACALASQPVRVGVIEAMPPDHAAQPSYDERTTVLAHGSQRIYQTLGLWDRLDAVAEPIRHIHISERGRFGVTRIDSHEQRVPALGYVVPNRVFGRVLFEEMARVDNLTVLCPATVSDISADRDGARVTVSQDGAERSLTARLLVGADGIRSRVREALGIGVREADYRQSALVTIVTPQRPRAGQAFERFDADGPVALLPVDAERYALIWTLPPARAQEMAGAPEASFLCALHNVFGDRLGAFLRVGARHVYPLKRVLSERLWAPHAVLIGNAAHNLHPVAGQGFNLGLRDAAVLAELIADAIAEGRDPGSEELLQHYQRWRAGDQARVAGFTHGLVKLFSNRWPALGPLRSAGLLGLDLLPGAKRWLARRTMGASGHMPRLARGLPLTERSRA